MIQWCEPTQWPELGRSVVQVWLASFQAWSSAIAGCQAVLSNDERDRAETFRIAARRDAAIITRGLLRRLVARHASVQADRIVIDQGTHGKPFTNLAGVPHFNTTHSDALVAFAFTRVGEVGVDVERVRPAIPRQIPIAEKYFAAGELNQLRATPDGEKSEAFFRCWTRKEAFLKARGEGVFGGLNTFEVTLAREDARLLRVEGATSQQPWWMASLPDVDQHVGAVVVQANECRLECWRATPDFFTQNNL